MLIPPGALLFCYCCCGLLRPRQMLRNQGLLKCRCRMLFNDLKVFLLRRPPAPPPPSPPPPLPMPGGAEAGAGGTAPPGGRGAGWRGAAGSPGAEEWGSPAGEPPASLPSSTSSDDFGKGKAEDRYSLGSSVDSGIRTPLCRICFQGPEQVRPRRAVGWGRGWGAGWVLQGSVGRGKATWPPRCSPSPVSGPWWGLADSVLGALCPQVGPWT